MGNGHLNNIRIIGVGLSQRRGEERRNKKKQAPSTARIFWLLDLCSIYMFVIRKFNKGLWLPRHVC